jgi:hypothetical protein
VEAAMRDEEYPALACGVREAADVGEKALGAGNV